MSATYDTIRQAMLLGKPVSLTYNSLYREVCVHALGLNKYGREQALTYQYAGDSTKGLPPGGEWRCIALANAFDARIIEGPWHTRNDHEETQTCVAQVDLELWVGPDGLPYVKRA